MDITKLHIGSAVRIRTNNDIYDSYISAITLTDENFVYFKTGSLRTTIVDKLKANKSEIGNKLDITGGKITGNLLVEKQLHIGNNEVIVEGKWTQLTLASGVTASENGLGGFKGIQYKKVGNHVYVRGSVSTTWDGSSGKSFATLPVGCRPKLQKYSFCPCAGGRIARQLVNTNGGIFLEWVKNITDGSNVTTQLAWVQVEIDFWID